MRLEKVYEPSRYEDAIYTLWEKEKAFTPKNRGEKGSYCIVVPPPNANADLHLGHGLTLALEDIAIRYNRMKGKSTLFLPGADHAGFETQVVYEKHLAKAGKTRFDFSREELYEQIWDFVAENKDNYLSQFRKLGASLDWDRYVYTLDQKIVDRAYATFKKMWDEGLVYRGERLVNFCTFHGTGFADIEVAYKQQKGNLWYIKYPLTDGSGSLTVATTRPETMLGDVAVAINPEDKRYKKFLGKTIKLPLTNREVPIVEDKMVDIDFGTGAVKITPAHDINDYELAQRHNLPMINLIDFEGKLNSEVPREYRGLTVDGAREQVVADLKQQGWLEKTEDHANNVGHCYKCNTVIQPLLKEQWFIDMQPLVKPAIKALKDKKIEFYPDSKRVQLIKYLEGLRDWNISRQVAWGIPIPAFVNVEDPDDWVFNTEVDKQELSIGDKTYRRDPDVFDTWFSSSSWPYATLDYPNGEDFDEFYPLSLMETAADILYPWVSRMIMFGLYNTGEIPFKKVYLHGLIQDEHGAKMSKSKGNVINPMEKVNRYGSDAFRMGIIADETAGQNRPYDESKVIGARNFCNKLWNIARFIENKVGSRPNTSAEKSVADEWILGQINKSVKKISEYLDKYRFAEAYNELYHLVWDDFADWYIESSKNNLNSQVLSESYQTILKLAHPFAPFVTEAIWQSYNKSKDKILAVNKWPTEQQFNKTKAKEFERVQSIVVAVRQLKSALKVNNPVLTYESDDLTEKHAELVTQLAGLKAVEKTKQGSGLKVVVKNHDIWLDVPDEKIDKYRDELEDKISELTAWEGQLKKRLANKSYLANAPIDLVNQTKSELDDVQTSLKKVQSDIKDLH